MVVLDDYITPARVLSIVALSATPLVVLFFRVYFRGIDLLQMCYLFAISMATTSFSSHLTPAMLKFDRTFYSDCSSGDFVCNTGFPLSFGTVLVAILVVTFVFVSFQKCCNKSIEYEPVFLVFKGFVKWIYVPLAYSSAAYVLVYVNMSEVVMSDILLPGIILAVTVLYPFCLIIGYKCIETEQVYPWRKWMEFLGYIRLLATSLLVAAYFYYGAQTYLHCIMIMLIIYFPMYLWKGEYKYPVLERIVFAIGEGIFLALFYIFKYKPAYITDYDIDFFGLAIIMGLDFLLFLVRGTKMYCYGKNEGSSEVHPEAVPSNSSSSPRVRKNKYEHDSGEEINPKGPSNGQLSLNSNIKRRRK